MLMKKRVAGAGTRSNLSCMKVSIALLAAGVLTTMGWSAETWSRFRGPNGSGVADAARPPVEFGPDKNVRWKVPVPSGLSSPIIAGDKVVMTAFEDGKLYTIAYKIKDGKEAWRAEAPATKLEPF